MKIVWLKQAENDLKTLTDYIAENSPRNALDIFEIIQISAEKLASYPFVGREGRIKETRELVIPNLPYIIVYTVKNKVQILAVLHTSLKWPTSF